MTKKRIAPTDAGTSARAQAETVAIHLQSHCSIKNAQKQEIFDLLPVGERNAISTPDLLAATGCGSVRELQSRISEERAIGNLILSRGAGGYFRPSPGIEGKQEINRYVATLRARAVNTLRTLQTAKAALAVLDGQIDIDGGGGE